MALKGNVNGDIKRNMAFDKMVIDTISFYERLSFYDSVYANGE